MTRVQVLEHEVKKLDRSSLAAFRNWFRRFDSTAWDRQIERDARAGKLGKLAKQALAAHGAGKTREF
jgi:hypothetical protein